MFFFCALFSVCLFGIPIALFIENMLDGFPLVITIIFISIGLYFLLVSFVLLRYPNYRLEGNKLFVRLITGKEISIIPDNTWEIEEYYGELALTKNKKSVGITSRRIGTKKFKDLCEKLNKMMESNSNQELQPSAKSGAG